MRSLCRLRSAPAASGTLPTISLRILPRMPGPLPRREPSVPLPVSFSAFIGLPQLLIRSASRVHPLNDFLAGPLFEAADIPLCSGLPVCSPPRSFPPLPYYRQGSQGFYVRAEHASLPSHASDMLAIRIQAIDGAKTSTSQDSHFCRLLLVALVRAITRRSSPRLT